VKYLPLIWSSLFRHKVRAVLTLLSIVTAFFLFGLLDSVKSTFDHAGQGARGADRLITIAKIDGAELPISLYDSIQALPGVKFTSYGNFLGGTYQDARNYVPVEAEPDNVFDLYPEADISPAAFQAFRSTRTGALVRADFAAKYGWKPGDKISFQTSVSQKTGSTTWTVDVVGIYDLPEPKVVLPPVMIRWDYFDEARESSGGTVSWYNAVVEDPSQTEAVAHAIDALSANSSYETATQSENALFANLVRLFANIGLIVGSIMGAVFFTLVLLTGNAMAQAMRERIAELATLQTIGFTGRCVLTLILSESCLLLLLGGTVGLAFAEVTVNVVRAKYGNFLPMPIVSGGIWARGLALAVLVALVVGAIPARRGMRLRIVDALAVR
jgi:putative ABC transport system permease protein